MKIMIIAILIWIIFFIYLYYKLKKEEYEIIKKFSINNGKNLEYYYVLKHNNETFKIKVGQEVYDIFEIGDNIVIS